MTEDEEENAARDLAKVMTCDRIIEIAKRLRPVPNPMAAWKMLGDFSQTRSESPGALDRIGGVAPSPLDTNAVNAEPPRLNRWIECVNSQGKSR